MNYNKLVDNYLTYISDELNYSVKTKIAYKKDFQNFTSFLEKEYEMGKNDTSSISRNIIREYLASLFEKGFAKKSIRRYLSSLRSIFKFAIRKNFISINPVSGVLFPKLEKKLPQFVSENRMMELINTYEPDSEMKLREKAIVELFYSTGIRRAELVGLNVDSVNFHSKTLKVTGKGNKQRFVPFGKTAKDNLLKYFEERKRFVSDKEIAFFVGENGSRILEHTVNKIVQKFFKRIPELKQKSPHIFRHSFATHMLNNGADIRIVKELLGHVSLSTTQLYTNITLDKLKKVYQQAHPKSN